MKAWEQIKPTDLAVAERLASFFTPGDKNANAVAARARLGALLTLPA